MKVLITLATNKDPIEAEIKDYNAKEFANLLNGQLLFIELGGNIINRGLIQMITPVNEATE